VKLILRGPLVMSLGVRDESEIEDLQSWRRTEGFGAPSFRLGFKQENMSCAKT